MINVKSSENFNCTKHVLAVCLLIKIIYRLFYEFPYLPRVELDSKL